MFCNWHPHLILFALLVMKSNLAVEITKESILALIPQVIHEDTYREIRDHHLPKLHRTSRQMQKMIVQITEKYSAMQVLMSYRIAVHIIQHFVLFLRAGLQRCY